MSSTTDLSNPADDLAGIFGPSTAAPVSTAQSIPNYNLAYQQPQAQPRPYQPQPQSKSSSNGNGLADLFNSSPPQSLNQTGVNPTFGSIMLPGTPQPASPPTRPMQPQGSFWSMQANTTPSRAVSGVNSFDTSNIQPSQTQQLPQQTTSGPSVQKDPFADLAGLF